MILTKNILSYGVRLLPRSKITSLRIKKCPTMYNALYFRAFCVSDSLASFSERRYTDKHEWVLVDGIIGTIGISKYAQEALGDVVFAQLPDPGTALKQHDECGALESVKAASEVYTPVSGEVSEKNKDVEETPALINTNCYDKGWLFKITLSNPAEIEKLMTEKQYEEFLKAVNH